MLSVGFLGSGKSWCPISKIIAMLMVNFLVMSIEYLLMEPVLRVPKE